MAILFTWRYSSLGGLFSLGLFFSPWLCCLAFGFRRLTYLLMVLLPRGGVWLCLILPTLFLTYTFTYLRFSLPTFFDDLYLILYLILWLVNLYTLNFDCVNINTFLYFFTRINTLASIVSNIIAGQIPNKIDKTAKGININASLLVTSLGAVNI